MKKNNTEVHCRSCNALMFWAETITGRRIPIDAAPVHDGNLRLVLRPNMIPLAINVTQVASFKNWQEKASKETYLSHFATCPQSKQWRRK